MLNLGQRLYLNRRLKEWCREQGWGLSIRLGGRLFLSGRSWDHEWQVIATRCRGDAGGGDYAFWDICYTIKQLRAANVPQGMLARKVTTRRNMPPQDVQEFLMQSQEESATKAASASLFETASLQPTEWYVMGKYKLISDLNLYGGVDPRQLQSVLVSSDAHLIRYWVRGVTDRAYMLSRSAQAAANLCGMWCEIEKKRAEG